MNIDDKEDKCIASFIGNDAQYKNSSVRIRPQFDTVLAMSGKHDNVKSACLVANT